LNTLVIGVGNPERGDDGAGIAVLRRLRSPRASGVKLRECRGEAEDLIAAWRGARRVILVDAALSGAHPGTVHRIEAHREPLVEGLRSPSAHDRGVADAVELARNTGRLPPSLVVYAIEGRTFHPGRDLSPSVRLAVERVERRVREEVRGATE
jgi:hydrogenase maturation protease